MPWWRARSWNTDLDTLTRLLKALRALDVGSEAQHKPAPAPAPPTPSTGRPAQQELLPAPQVVMTEQQALFFCACLVQVGHVIQLGGLIPPPEER